MRNLTAARAKVRDEAQCRACHRPGHHDPAHIIPRSRIPGPEADDPQNIIPLCRRCHDLQHAGRLEMGLLLTTEEWFYAEGLVGATEATLRLVER